MEHVLTAFSVLSGDDVSEEASGGPPVEGESVAAGYTRSKLEILPHGASTLLVERVLRDVTRQLAGNPVLVARLSAARPIAIDLVPPGKSIASFGYPRSAARRAAGLFWAHPDGLRARIALRRDRLDAEPALVVHELAHAIHALAFTQEERDRIYRVLLPTYHGRDAADEVFALYSEREFLEAYSSRDLQAPGVYGAVRARWSEDDLFTRFVRGLYFPHKPFASSKSIPTR
jgi:hypothetical protein